MDIGIYTIVFVVSAIVFYLIGRKTAKKEDQLSNDQIIQQRALLQEQIESNKQKLQEIDEEYNRQKDFIENVKQAADEVYEQRLAALDEKIEQERIKKFSAFTDEINLKSEEVKVLSSKLDSLKSTYASAVEAMRQEKNVGEHPEIYCMQFSADELHDMDYLNQIKPKLRHPEILGKIIWSTFMQKKYNSFAAAILGTEDVCGIYKITDQLTKEAYVGQSSNIKTRWRDHMKCGVGASAVSPSNQLYAAMRRDGIESFSFELLEKCSKEELNSKEKYFIELYQTDKIGLNSTRGNER